MTMKKFSLCLALLLTISVSVSIAEPFKVKGDATYKEGDKIVLVASDLSSPDVQLLWDFSGTNSLDYDENIILVSDPKSTKEKPLPNLVIQGGKCCVWAKVGKYVVTLTSVDFTTRKIQRTRFNFTVESKIPPPPPPTPVSVPDVGNKTYKEAKSILTTFGLLTLPTSANDLSTVSSQVPEGGSKVQSGSTVTLTLSDKPPEPPTPPSPPSPISDPGYRVLIVYETGELSKLPPAQRLITTSATIRAYLRKTCANDSTADQDGKAYRLWDVDSDTKSELKSWQDAMKRPRKSLPWIIISNGKTGYEGPLPADVDSTLALLKKYELPTNTTKKQNGK